MNHPVIEIISPISGINGHENAELNTGMLAVYHRLYLWTDFPADVTRHQLAPENSWP